MIFVGHFDKREYLKLPKGDTSTPSGFFSGDLDNKTLQRKNYLLQI